MKRKNITPKGRSQNPEGQYLKLNHSLLNHDNFHALNGNAIKVLLEVASKHNGYNNGKIAASSQCLANTLGMSKSTVHTALRNLEYFGFVKLIKRGYFTGRRASEWEITFLRSEGSNPTNEWKLSKPRLKPRKRTKKESLFSEITELSEFKEQRLKSINLVLQ